MIKSHTFREKRWKIVDSDTENGGHCDAPHIKHREMWIPINGESKEDLDTILHESLHATLWILSEESVCEIAGDISNLLWRLGWRKID